MTRLRSGSVGLWAPWTAFFPLALFFAASCAPIGPGAGTRSLERIDFSRYQDAPLSTEIASWLKPGPQSGTGALIRQAAGQIDGLTRRERLYRAVDYIWRHFRYDRWLNDRMFGRTAAELFRDGTLGGCSDFALAEVALFRAAGIPSRLALTANVDWMLRHQDNSFHLPTGHVFIEVYLEDRWYLVDSTYRQFFVEFLPDEKCYPRREFLLLKGRDYWDMGIRQVSDLVAIMEKRAAAFRESAYRDPGYPSEEI